MNQEKNAGGKIKEWKMILHNTIMQNINNNKIEEVAQNMQTKYNKFIVIKQIVYLFIYIYVHVTLYSNSYT